MPACPSCGEQNPDRARFCLACGTKLEVAPPSEVRKVVTVVFSDVTGSTSIGERLDPEAMRRVMDRYFAAMRAIIEAHGGTVEKFIGDAVMAVFGVPVVHEDDALRAVRAAMEMGETLARLNEDLEREWGVTIQVRTGVNTGEVVAGALGGGETIATGDTVNVAARLEQNARPGEILIGEQTHRLVRDAVQAEPVEPLELKGKEERIPAYRLVGVTAGAEGTARRLDSPLVGRAHELSLGRQALERAVRERTCHLFTILGSAGVGKSRLTAELLRSAEDQATVLRGRCLPYGKGITFWPLVEIVHAAAAIDEGDDRATALDRLRSLLEGEENAELIAERVAQLVGIAEGAGVLDESVWAVRKLLETLARRRPLVAVVEDVHWAEPALLDVIEHVADWVRDAPMLLVCTARPDLLDLRPNWGGGKMNATSILLEPLGEDESRLLVENLLGGSGLPEPVGRRISASAEGNPLFVEEMVGMLIDEGLLVRTNGAWTATGDIERIEVPPTIHSLLSSRLDRLAPQERQVVECASVVGREFWRGSVAALTTEELRPAVGGALMALVRKELIRPERSSFAGDDTYKFRHALIRDAAYNGVPKQTRARLHQEFAEWLEHAAQDRLAEFEEILAYHLEQAYAYRAALGPVDEEARALGEKAAARLVLAGGRALARGDSRAAVKLLESAAGIDSGSRCRALDALGGALVDVGELERAQGVLEEAEALAQAAGDAVQLHRVRLSRMSLVGMRSEGAQISDLMLRTADEAAPVLDAAGDTDGLWMVWMVRAHAFNLKGIQSRVAEAAEKALAYADLSGSARGSVEALQALGAGLVWGPEPLDRVVERYGAELARSEHGVLRRAMSLQGLGVAAGLQGDPASGIASIQEARAIFAEVGLAFQEALASFMAAVVAHAAADLDTAEELARGAVERFEQMGERSFMSTLVTLLGLLLYQKGQLDEAMHWSRVSEEAAAADDIVSQIYYRIVRALVLAKRNEERDARALADEAVALAETTESPVWKADALASRGEVLATLGDRDAARRDLLRARELYDAKGATLTLLPIGDLIADLG